MKPIRILWKSALLLGIVAIIQLALFVLLSPDWTNSYLAANFDKEALLREPGKDRVLFAGGSNLAFGLDSYEMERTIGRSTINLGLHGGLGLCFMLSEVSKGARRGDVVILVPEYHHFFGTLAYGEVEALEVLEFNPRALGLFHCWRQGLEVAKRIGSYNLMRSQKLLQSGLQGLTSAEAQVVPTDESPLYERSAFNAKGDMVRHLGRQSRSSWQLQIDRLEGEINKDAIKKVKEMAVSLQSRGIGFRIVFPAVARSFWNVNSDAAALVAAELGSLSENTPESSVYEDSLFFDTYYHLNEQGRKIRTEELGAIVGRILNSTR